MKGWWRHFGLTFRLNFRNPQALVYGYLVPVVFLLAFGSAFRASVPPLLHEMGQLITITILGGACFGMPTAIVAERERGIWRRYQLLPTSMAGLMASTMAARYFLVLSAVLLQLGLAWALYRTPPPARPAEFLVAFSAVCFAFLGMGLVIAMAADTVPAVQALGQAVFLPMILVGGVGVPLRALPPGVQRLAGFLPGRYAVEALDATYLSQGAGLRGCDFALGALVAIGLAAGLAGSRMARWEGGRRLAGRNRLWIGLALAGWLAVGLTADATGRLPSGPSQRWQDVTRFEIAAVDCEDLPPDSGVVTPLASGLGAETRARLAAILPAASADPLQDARDLLSVAAIYDILQDPDEGEIALLVFDTLRDRFSSDDLQKALTFLAEHPEDGTVRTTVPGGRSAVGEEVVRERVLLYALKLLRQLRSA